MLNLMVVARLFLPDYGRVRSGLMLLLSVFIASSVVADDKPVPVRVARVETLAIYPEYRAPATVITQNLTTVSAELAARVTAMPARVGDMVDQGARLVAFDCRSYTNAVDAARAALDVLRARLVLTDKRLERARELHAKKSIAVEVLDERDADKAVLVNEIKRAETELKREQIETGRCRINAPFRALVTQRLAGVGSYASKGTALLEIADLDALELAARVSATDVAEAVASEKLVFVANGEVFPVSLRVAVQQIDTSARNQELRFTFAAAKPLLGSSGELLWRSTKAHVPGRVLVEREGVNGIFVLNNKQAQFVALPHAAPGRASAVELSGDALVIVEGHYSLGDGQAVKRLD